MEQASAYLSTQTCVRCDDPQLSLVQNKRDVPYLFAQCMRARACNDGGNAQNQDVPPHSAGQ